MRRDPLTDAWPGRRRQTNEYGVHAAGIGKRLQARLVAATAALDKYERRMQEQQDGFEMLLQRTIQQRSVREQGRQDEQRRRTELERRAVARQWRATLLFLLSERGPIAWEPSGTHHWRLDRREMSERMRRRLALNDDAFTDHADASRARDSGQRAGPTTDDGTAVKVDAAARLRHATDDDDDAYVPPPPHGERDGQGMQGRRHDGRRGPDGGEARRMRRNDGDGCDEHVAP